MFSVTGWTYSAMCSGGFVSSLCESSNIVRYSTVTFIRIMTFPLRRLQFVWKKSLRSGPRWRKKSNLARLEWERGC